MLKVRSPLAELEMMPVLDPSFMESLLVPRHRLFRNNTSAARSPT